MNRIGGMHQSRGGGYVVAQLLLIVLTVFGPTELWGVGRWGQPWSAVSLPAGLVLIAAGLMLLLWGATALGRGNLTPFPRPPEDATLITTGPYAWVRHPIYSAVTLIAVGWALVRRSPWTVLYAVLLLVVLDVKARREERWLQQRFPGYARYRRGVRRFVPFLY